EDIIFAANIVESTGVGGKISPSSMRGYFNRDISPHIQQRLDKRIVVVGRKINLIVFIIVDDNAPACQRWTKSHPTCLIGFDLSNRGDLNSPPERPRSVMDIRIIYPVAGIAPQPKQQSDNREIDET